MRTEDHSGGLEGRVRRAFEALCSEELPCAARRRGWPVSSAEAFERLLLDHVLDAPWETRLRGPDGACVLDLVLAVEAGARVLEGSLCLSELNRRSLALRAPPATSTRRSAPAFAPDGAASVLDGRPGPAAGTRPRRARR